MTCRVRQYLSRLPERLVVSGYRSGLDACATGDGSSWAALRALYHARLGEADAGIAMAGLAGFIVALGRCAQCPLRYFPAPSCHLCRHECLVLSLIAALQHGDEDSAMTSARCLAGSRDCEQLLAAAGDYAMRLKILGCLLLPIPPNVVAQFLTGEPDDGRTLH